MWKVRRFAAVDHLTKLNNFLLLGVASLIVAGLEVTFNRLRSDDRCPRTGSCGSGLSGGLHQTALIFDDDGDLVGDDVRRPDRFSPGAVLYLEKNGRLRRQVPWISPLRPLRIRSTFNEDGKLLYDVKDLAVSPDGKNYYSLCEHLKLRELTFSPPGISGNTIWRVGNFGE